MSVGIGAAVLAPTAYSMIADCVEPERRGRALAAYCVAIGIGSGAALLLGGWLLAVIPPQGLDLPMLGLQSPWRLAFLAAALPGLPLGLVLLWLVREPARMETRAAGGAVGALAWALALFDRAHGIPPAKAGVVPATA